MSTVGEIERNFGEEVRQGLIEVIAPPKEWFPPNLENIRPTLGDSPERMRWRAKQSLDYAYAMYHTRRERPEARFYVQLEDDVITVPGFLSELHRFANAHSEFFVCEFSNLGFIGRMFHNGKDLAQMAHFVLLLYRLDETMKQCMKKRVDEIVLFRRKPPLFQHIGRHSSLPGKITKIRPSAASVLNWTQLEKGNEDDVDGLNLVEFDYRQRPLQEIKGLRVFFVVQFSVNLSSVPLPNSLLRVRFEHSVLNGFHNASDTSSLFSSFPRPNSAPLQNYFLLTVEPRLQNWFFNGQENIEDSGDWVVVGDGIFSEGATVGVSAIVKESRTGPEKAVFYVLFQCIIMRTLLFLVMRVFWVFKVEDGSYAVPIVLFGQQMSHNCPHQKAFPEMYQPPPPPPSSLFNHSHFAANPSTEMEKSAASLMRNAFAGFSTFCPISASSSPFPIPSILPPTSSMASSNPSLSACSPPSFSSCSSSTILSVPHPPLIGSGKRERTKYSEEQLRHLDKIFKTSKYPDAPFREQIAKSLQLTEVKVQVWFKNRRAKRKLEQMRAGSHCHGINTPSTSSTLILCSKKSASRRSANERTSMKREESVDDTEEENQQPPRKKAMGSGGADVKDPSTELKTECPSSPSSSSSLMLPYDHLQKGLMGPQMDPFAYSSNSSSSTYTANSSAAEMGSLMAVASNISPQVPTFYNGWPTPSGYPSGLLSSSYAPSGQLPQQFGPFPAYYQQMNNYYFNAAQQTAAIPRIKLTKIMVRDRLNELRHQQQQPAFHSLAHGQFPSPIPAELDVQSLQSSGDPFLDHIAQMRQSMEEIERRIRTLPEDKKQMDALIEEIRQRSGKLRPKLRQLGWDLESQGMAADALLRMRRNHSEQLKRRLNELLEMFASAQEDYRQRVNRRVRRQLALAGEQLSAAETNFAYFFCCSNGVGGRLLSPFRTAPT
uniref:Homeobox domain-containing protein n=1 Tax=Globodera rostochiensis TaxID=31243 RepID=A0A914HDL7_GLORO